ncbi:cupin 2 domain-containing protein [Ferrimonas sediminum]|uniref:Cupin 2 domain-containing protein n=1 Tax=Ferrimonas sediminum TaxID=718193 RepID=A0A1G8R3Q9_9GAMM|nr:cupin 2 domain-containing protein [Ferrimonas sediminum]
MLQNLLTNLPQNLTNELFETLVDAKSVKIERILSKGQQTPAGKWYDQDQHEWVLVVAGGAKIVFEDGSRVVMGPGDHLLLEAHRKHRVSWTDPDQTTVWLAVHWTECQTG